MRAVELEGLDGPDSLKLVDIEQPTPGPGEVLIRVEAAGVNFADVEITRGRYPATLPLPYVIGFETAGVVTEVGAGVEHLHVGDRVAAVGGSGGYAEYAAVDAASVIRIPPALSFAEATTITIQGVTAYALLKFAARIQPGETILIQAAAGGVGLFLVQLAKILGAGKVIALAGSCDKLELVRSLGADVAVNYRESNWADRVRAATGDAGVDIVLESVAGAVGDESSQLLKPFGRTVVFGAQNAHEPISAERVRQLMHDGQSIVGFHVRGLRPDQFGECVSSLFDLLNQGRLRLFANVAYPLEEARKALEAIASRNTIGKVVLVP